VVNIYLEPGMIHTNSACTLSILLRRKSTDEDDQDGHFFYNHPERGAYFAA